MPEAKYISKIQIVDGDSYNMKDKQARDDIQVYLPSETISIDNNNQISISDTYQQKTTNIESSILTIQGDVSDLDDSVSSLNGTVSNIEGSILSIQDNIDDLTDRVAEVEQTAEGSVWIVPSK